MICYISCCQKAQLATGTFGESVIVFGWLNIILLWYLLVTGLILANIDSEAQRHVRKEQ